MTFIGSAPLLLMLPQGSITKLGQYNLHAEVVSGINRCRAGLS
jgi:hypothetical protein